MTSQYVPETIVQETPNNGWESQFLDPHPELPFISPRELHPWWLQGFCFVSVDTLGTQDLKKVRNSLRMLHVTVQKKEIRSSQFD